MNYLVTGGCGFIGTRLVARLLASERHAVRVVDDLSVGRRESLLGVCRAAGRSLEEGGAGVWRRNRPELRVADVRDAAALGRAAEGAEVVVHLAAEPGVASSVEDPARNGSVNVFGTLHALEGARRAGARRFVFASSGAAVGQSGGAIHEDLSPRPTSPYGAAKLAGEAYCSAYFHSFGLETVVLRFGNVYGVGSDHKESVVARFVRRALAGQPLEIYGDGSATRDFIDCDDLVGAIVRSAGLEGIGGETFQIASASETSVIELVDVLLPILRSVGVGSVELRHLPARFGDVQTSWADTSKAARMLGWRAQVTLDEGLRKTVEWFAKRAPAAGAGAAGAWLAGSAPTS